MNVDTEKIVEKIVKETGMSEEEVKKRIHEKIKAFAGLLTEAGAAYALAKELGLDVDIDRELSQKVKVKDLKPGMDRVDLVVRVLRIFPPRVFKTDERSGKYCRLIVGDETGTVRMTLWNRDVSMVEKGKIEVGDVLEIINGHVREFKGEPVLTVAFDTRIIVNPEVKGIEKLPVVESTLVKVRDITPDMKNVDVILKVIRVFPEQTVHTDKGETKMKAFIGADETGTIRVVLWGERANVEIKEGDVVKIISGYAREGTQGVSLHVGAYGILQKRPDLAEQLSEVKSRPRSKRKLISELEEGDKFVEVRGTVVHVYNIRPISAICNACGAKAEWKDGKWVCTSCGSTDVRVVPIVSFEIDDGTGTIRVIGFDKVAGYAYGEVSGPGGDLHARAVERLNGREVVISGYVRRNTYSDDLEMVAKTIREPKYDYEVKRALRMLKQRLEEQGKLATEAP